MDYVDQIQGDFRNEKVVCVDHSLSLTINLSLVTFTF